ncbi:carbohydrate ABC transporter permease [Micromonospora echinofusca]|uniref:carbohydrate ABC transporter permease n=1 Tax=Micromonospora echinofusca TaxID=47858 RepID=UPI001AD6E598|nr:sugar ABC transporter permease [Micromonospora echinofusca]
MSTTTETGAVGNTTPTAPAGPPTGRPAALRRWRDLGSRWLFLAPALAILVAVLAYPLFYTVRISFSELDLATFTPARNVGWLNYRTVLEDPGFLNSVKVTGVYLALALPLQMVLGFGIAFLLNVDWRGRGVLRALFLIPMVVVPVVAGGVWKMLLDPMWGFVNYVLGLVGVGPVDWLADPTLAMVSLVLIDTWRWTPFVVLIASAGLMSLPTDVFEAARVDGAGWFATLRKVTLPLLAPVILAAFIVRWLGAVKMFDIALAATKGGPGQATDVVNLYIYEKAFRGLEFGTASSMATLVLALTMLLTFLFLRLNRFLEKRW